MPYNGSGQFISPGYPYFPAVPNTYIIAAYFNTVINDIYQGLSTAVTKDGQNPMAANFVMSNFRILSLGAGVLATDAVNYQQVFVNPVFTNPKAVADPPAVAVGQELTTAAWVKAQLVGANAIGAYQGLWSTIAPGTAVNPLVPYSVGHVGHIWMLAKAVADVRAVTPGTDNTTWIDLTPDSAFLLSFLLS